MYMCVIEHCCNQPHLTLSALFLPYIINQYRVSINKYFVVEINQSSYVELLNTQQKLATRIRDN